MDSHRTAGKLIRQTQAVAGPPAARRAPAWAGLALLLQLLLVPTLRAATPAAAQLLPTDTLLVLSVPDWDKAAAFWTESAYGKLWQDPALKTFRDRLLERWTEEVAGPLERELGIKLSEYLELAHGQLTFAVTQNEWGTRPEAKPGLMLIIDTKDKQAELKSRLEAVKKKWLDAGKHLKTERMREVEFTTLLLSDQDLNKTLEKIFPHSKDDSDPDAPPQTKGEGANKPGTTEISFAQSGSLFVIGNNEKDLERLVARQTGTLGANLSEQASYESNHAALFRDALGLVWVNFARVFEAMQKQGNPGPNAPPDKLLGAMGLGGIKTVAGRVNGSSEGVSGEVVVSVPESRRLGLFRLLVPERRDSGPPPFVGAEVIKFKRLRIDGQKAWSTLENILTSISPEIAGLVQLGLQAAGKDRDPNFDLKRALVGNLGNDFILLEKNPRSASLADVNAPPSLFLIGSANSEQLIQGIKAATGLMPLAAGAMPEIKEHEFLGRKIYSLALPSPPGEEPLKGPPLAHDFNFAAGGGYAAMSTDIATLESYLRSAEASGKPLHDLPGLNEAAQKVGGMSSGFFGYENQAETIRLWLDSAKRESAALDKLLSLAPLAGGKPITAEERKNMKDWVDVSLLPPFEKISKYFYFLVYSLSASEEGLSWKMFAPTPPQAR